MFYKAELRKKKLHFLKFSFTFLLPEGIGIYFLLEENTSSGIS